MIRAAALGWLTGALWLISRDDLDDLPAAWVGSAWAWAIAIALLAWAAARLRGAARGPYWRALGAYGIAALLGFAVTGWQAAQRLDDRLAPALEGRSLTLLGTVSGMAENTGGGGLTRWRFEFLPIRPPTGVPSRLRLTWRPADAAAPAPLPGERWRVEVRLKPPRGLRNPGGFDYERWLFTRGIGATGYVRAAKRLTAGATGLDGARGALADAIAQRVDPAAAGVLAAITVGDRRYLTDTQQRLLRATGTSHLVAISGLHIGLIAGFAYAVMRGLRRLGRGRCAAATAWLGGVRSATAAAMLAAVGYAALAGFSLPTQRALIMLLVLFGARLLARPLALGQGIALALIAVLLLSPLAVLEPGFWLSFVAVAALFYIALGERGGWLRRAVWAQFAIFLGLLPVLAFWFGAVPVWSPLINALAIPAFGVLVVPAALLGAVLLPWFAALGGGCLALAGQAVAVFWRVLAWCAQGPVALEWAVAQAPVGVYVWALPGLLLLCLPRPLRPTLAGLSLYLPLLALSPPKPSEGTAWVTFMDVGLGAAVLVQTHDHALLYDAGPRYRTGFDTGAAVVTPVLRARGVKTLDRIVISHDDLDHAGGLPAVSAAFPTAAVVASAPISGFAGAVRRCRRGESWRWNGVRFAFLHPPEGYAGNDNNQSCVLRIEAAGAALLLTGDIQRRAERELLAALPAQALAAAVLQTPHHGSATSSSAAFVQAVRPAIAVVSTAFRNRYDFPKPVVRRRYQSIGAALYSTGAQGAVTLRLLGGNNIVVDASRTARRRLWQWNPP